MKKLLALLLVLVMCFSCIALTACNCGGNDDVPPISDAVTMLKGMLDSKKTATESFKVPTKLSVNGSTFTVAWTVDNATITLTDDGAMKLVNIPEINATEFTFKLSAKITSPNGETADREWSIKVPVKTASAGSNVTEGTAYKLYLLQNNAGGQRFYALNTITGSKYIATTNDPKAAVDYYVEKSGDGYKFYTMDGEAKSYVEAYLVWDETNEDWSKRLRFTADAEAASVWFWETAGSGTNKEGTKAWFTQCDENNQWYVLGTYNSYTTFSISEESHMTKDKTGVSQFPATFVTKAEAEAETPDEVVIPEVSLTTIANALAIATPMTHDTTTSEKYFVSGIITEIKNATYGNLYISDGEGNTLYIYGLYEKGGVTGYKDMTTKPGVGDTITVWGILGNYNGPQMKNGWLIEHTAHTTCEYPTEGLTAVCTVCGKVNPAHTECADSDSDSKCDACGKSTAPATITSIVDANAIASAQTSGYTTDKYYVTGVITEIKNATYGNLYIGDGQGNTLYIYGLYSADGTVKYDAMTTKPVVGDTITVWGVLGKYNDSPQMQNGWVTEHVPGEGGETPDTPATKPVVGTGYNLGMVHGGLNKTLWADGNVQSASANYRFTTVEGPCAAVIFYVEETEGGYYLYVMNGDTKTYVNIKQNGNYVNNLYEATAESVWVWDETLGTLKVTVADVDYVMGTASDKSYNNFEAKKVSDNPFYGKFSVAVTEHTYTTLANKCDACGNITTHECADSDSDSNCDTCGKYVAPASSGYTQVTSVAVGDKIVMAYSDGNVFYEFGGVDSSNKGLAISYTGEFAPVAVIEVVAGASEGTVAFKVGETYLAWKADGGNKLFTSTTIDAYASWTITANDDNSVVITNQGSTDRILQFNANNTQERFCCYKATQKSVTLWKITETTEA